MFLNEGLAISHGTAIERCNIILNGPRERELQQYYNVAATSSHNNQVAVFLVSFLCNRLKMRLKGNQGSVWELFFKIVFVLQNKNIENMFDNQKSFSVFCS